MTLSEAFKEFTESAEFKAIAKEKNSKGGKYRLYLSYFKKDGLQAGAMVNVLTENGYEVEANKVKKKRG